MYLLKLLCELNNLVLKVSEAPTLWYPLNALMAFEVCHKINQVTFN